MKMHQTASGRLIANFKKANRENVAKTLDDIKKRYAFTERQKAHIEVLASEWAQKAHGFFTEAALADEELDSARRTSSNEVYMLNNFIFGILSTQNLEADYKLSEYVATYFLAEAYYNQEA